MFKSTKTYGHEVGLSCCFRQWKAESHCNLLHGYAISVGLEFEAAELDHRNWVIDFGGLGEVKQFLKDYFDHTLLVADDDPELDLICSLYGMGIAKVVVLPAVGCEAFSRFIAGHVETWLHDNGHYPRVTLNKVEVREHGANSAIWSR